jgi:hypothetical protein
MNPALIFFRPLCVLSCRGDYRYAIRYNGGCPMFVSDNCQIQYGRGPRKSWKSGTVMIMLASPSTRLGPAGFRTQQLRTALVLTSDSASCDLQAPTPRNPASRRVICQLPGSTRLPFLVQYIFCRLGPAGFRTQQLRTALVLNRLGTNV